jgi:hypothetical protein
MKPGRPEPKTPCLKGSSESESFRTRLIEGSPDCIKVLDLDGRLQKLGIKRPEKAA